MLVLASASPRRQELLRNARIDFQTKPAGVEEQRLSGEEPMLFARRLAQEKAEAVWKQMVNAQTSDQLYVLGADTIVIIDTDVLGKPANPDDAVRMLQRLSGRTHRVITAVCLMGGKTGLSGRVSAGRSAFQDVRAETTEVSFDEISPAEIESCVASGEPLDKAGAYAIQGTASRWIHSLKGDYSNVVGLPVRLVYRMLREHGVMNT